jgi:ABC-type branched-subunit amino acid transport system ATPase component/ABC-type branched-subunit amino acid transport system permease subunit
VALVVVLVVAGFLFLPAELLYAGSTSMVAGLVGLGLFLPIAALREMPLNAAGMAGLGAYLFTYFGSHGGVDNHLAGVAVALASVVTVSLLGGLASLAVTGLYFVVASLVIQVGIEKVIFSIPVLTGGAAGRSVWQPDLSGWFDTQRCIYLIVALIVLVCAVAVGQLLKSRSGYHAVLVGHVPEGASAIGIHNWVVKLLVFALSGVMIGVAGCLYGFVNGTPPPPVAFGIIFSVIFVAIPIASGMRNLASIWLVAGAFTCIPIALEGEHISPNLMSAVILLTALLLGVFRERIGRFLSGVLLRIRRGGAEDAPEMVALTGHAVTVGSANGHGRASDHSHALATIAHVDLPSHRKGRSPLGLQGRDVTVDFGGVRAVDRVSVRVGPGERVGIVGANGAGKTTLFNALTGFVPCEGTVLLGSEDISGWPPYLRARKGIRRTFQVPRLADVLTVDQNVLCGHGHDDLERRQRIEWLLDHFGLTARRNTPVAALPFGVRREVELIRALSITPQVLMLDEPVSGLEDEEAEKLVEALADLQRKEGWGLLVIEHDLKFITSIAERLMVMEDGHLLLEGPTQQALKADEVRRVYLGETVAV